MTYLKNLTLRQWLIILVTVLFFLVAYFFFTKEPIDQQKIDIEKLLNQGTAPMTTQDNVGRDKLERFLNPPPSTGASDTVRQITNEEKNALFKLMSAPKNE